MDEVAGREYEFYMDQLSERECRLSEEIDDDYEAERQEFFLKHLLYLMMIVIFSTVQLAKRF